MIEAMAEFIPEYSNGFDGYVLFTQKNSKSPVIVEFKIVGPASDGLHGIHVHEKRAECLYFTEDCCNTLGGHYDPIKKWSPNFQNGTPHGHHVGDLCFNILFKNGKASYTYKDHVISLFPGNSHNIVGRSIVLHKDRDDLGINNPMIDDIEDQKVLFESLQTGNAGKRLSCANIDYLTEIF